MNNSFKTISLLVAAVTVPPVCAIEYSSVTLGDIIGIIGGKIAHESEATDDLTVLMHTEIATHPNTILTEETHPILYAMVRKLTEQAHVEMPRYISTFNAQYMKVPKDGGVISTETRNMNAYVDILGDLYLCLDLLKTLSYEEIQGVVALALAQKNMGEPLKLAGVFATTLGATIVGVYCLNKYYNNALVNFFIPNKTDYYYRTFDTREQELKVISTVLLFPSMCTTIVAANYMRKAIDINAAAMVGKQKIIDAIRAIDKINNMDKKEGFLSRMAEKIRLKEFFKAIFYPVRGYTSEERIAYLTALQNA